MSINSDYARNAAQIMANSAAARANAQRQSGQIWGQTLSNIGQIASDTITQIPKIREQERAAKAQEAQDQQLRDLFSSDQMPSPSAIIKAVGPERGSKIINGLASLRGDVVDPQTQFEKTQKVLRNVILGMNAIPDDLRGQAYPSVRQSLIQRGVIKPEDAPEQYDPAWWAQTAAYGQEPPKKEDPKMFNLGVGGKLVDAEGNVIADNPQQQREITANPTEASLALAAARGDQAAAQALKLMRSQRVTGSGGGGGSSSSGLVDAVMANPNIYNTLTPSAKTAIAPELAKRGFKGFESPNAGKAPTGAQNKALSFFNRAKQASDDMQSIEGEIAKMGLGGQTRMALAPNFAQTQTGQLYNQAQRAFTEARLRKDSGAAIPDSEFANDRRTYFVQPGDSPETIAQKARARAGVLASIAFEAGPALHQFYGDDADAMIESYKGSAKRPDAKTADPLGIR